MALLDSLAIVLLVAAGCAFAGGELALARADDLHGIYWLGVGIASLRASVQIARPGGPA